MDKDTGKVLGILALLGLAGLVWYAAVKGPEPTLPPRLPPTQGPYPTYPPGTTFTVVIK